MTERKEKDLADASARGSTAEIKVNVVRLDQDEDVSISHVVVIEQIHSLKLQVQTMEDKITASQGDWNAVREDLKSRATSLEGKITSLGH